MPTRRSSASPPPSQKLIGSEFAGYFTDPELARECHREAFSRGSLPGYPLAVRRASGQLTHLLCSAALYRNRQNQAEGVVVIAHDVSQQKQREDELARLHADMMFHAQELKNAKRRSSGSMIFMRSCRPATRSRRPIPSSAR